MSRTTVELDGAAITGWQDFHATSKAAFGFPDFYGNNISAWIDCMSGLRDDDGMSRFVLGDTDTLSIRLLHSKALRQRAPHVLEGLQAAVDEVNARCSDAGEAPLLELRLN